MAADDPIEPISADRAPRVPSLPDVDLTPVTRPTALPAGSAPPAQELADPLERSLLVGTDVPDEPPVVQTRATVHDAAVHGEAYARAIEDAARASDAAADAQRPDPNSIGQVLGGAAAAAYSGQAAQIDRTRTPRDERTEHAEDPTSPLDVLAPLRRTDNDDESARRRRQQDERDRLLTDPNSAD